MRRQWAVMAAATAMGIASLGGIVQAFFPTPPQCDTLLGVSMEESVVVIRVPSSILAFARDGTVRSHDELVARASSRGLLGAWYVVTTRGRFTGGAVLPETLVKRLGVKSSAFAETRAMLDALAGRPGILRDHRTYGGVEVDFRGARIVELDDDLMREDPMTIVADMLGPDEKAY